jgi:L-lactate dehydrogenase complex protein LldG
MSSRDNILNAVKNNQPPLRELPSLPGGGGGGGTTHALTERFISVLEAIGGVAYIVSGYDRVATILREEHPEAHRIVSSCPELAEWATAPSPGDDPHTFEDVDLAVLKAHFGVAENGACWITEDRMIHRALPFITQHLALIIDRNDIVADMHAAYDRIAALEAAGGNSAAGTTYGFATFIAGPSKTADIEQSLVLGAHGPRSMIVFLLDTAISDAGFY